MKVLAISVQSQNLTRSLVHVHMEIDNGDKVRGPVEFSLFSVFIIDINIINSVCKSVVEIAINMRGILKIGDSDERSLDNSSVGDTKNDVAKTSLVHSNNLKKKS